MLKLVSALVLATVAIGSSATAAPPTQVRGEVDITFFSRGISRMCGFDVYRTLQGSFLNTLFYDESGRVVRELDTSSNFTVGFFSPPTGRSFSYPSAGLLETKYNPDGTAVATLTGLQAIVQRPGQPPLAIKAGRQVFNAVVVFYTPEGVPVIDFVGDPIFESSNFTPDIVDAFCAVLSP